MFCPKVIAGLGGLHTTVESRSIPIRLKRKLATEHVDRFRDAEVEAKADPVRWRLERWSEGGVVNDLRGVTPEWPGQLGDRAAQIWEPLFAIADRAGGGWPAHARSAALDLMSRQRQPSDGVLLLGAIREAFGERGDPVFLRTDELVTALNSDPGLRISGRLTARGLATSLEQYEIGPVRPKQGDHRDRRGYWRSDFEDAWARYVR